MLRNKKNAVKGIILWRGQSPINFEPIVVIAVMQSDNRKTGNMVQVYILREDISPLKAVMSGEDFSVCGNCPHRGGVKWESDGPHNRGRTCYVEVDKGPFAVWKQFKAGKYVDYQPSHLELFRGRKVRWGAYGDPALIPEDILLDITAASAGHTGYTHQHNRFIGQSDTAKRLFMASCETKEQAQELWARGYRTFRVGRDEQDLLPQERLCLNYTHQISCEDCGLCDGNIKNKRANIVIPVHGSKGKTKAFIQSLQLIGA